MAAPLYSREELRDAFLALLPDGRAWPKEPDGNLARTVEALVRAYERLCGRDAALLADAFPGTTAELLPEWEASLGLPDPCQGLAPTLEARRAQVVARLRRDGGLTVPQIVAFARDLGYEVTVTEFDATRAGMARAGDTLVKEGAQYVLRVNAPAVTTRRFRAGVSAAGEPLLSIAANEVMECELQAIKPAHVTLVFGYG